MKELEFIAAVLTGVAVWMAVKRNVMSFPTGILAVLLSVFVLFEAKLYGDMSLQVFFGVMQIHGWMAWSGSQKLADERIAVRQLSEKNWLLAAGSALLGTALFGWFLDEKTDSPLPYLDGFTTAVSVVAQVCMNLRFFENWWLWLLVNVFYVPILWSRDLRFMAILYAVLLVMAWFGMLEWKKKLPRPANSD